MDPFNLGMVSWALPDDCSKCLVYEPHPCIDVQNLCQGRMETLDASSDKDRRLFKD